jgi:thiamine-phosphate pyrophosphorylase
MSFKTSSFKPQTSKVLRIIDVNFNRATEGLRVVEEICRFVLEDRKLTLTLKMLRGELFQSIRVSDYQIIRERKALKDVGRGLYPESEGRRASLEDIFRANMKRAQEAVRCLEEFSKMLRPGLGKVFKNIRFKLYEVEKIMAPKVAKVVKLDFDLYLITDPQFGHLKMIRQAIASGIKIVQFRDKVMNKREYLYWAKKIAALTKKAKVTFMLNDHWDLVNEVGADGVHLGQEDLASISLRKVRKELGEEKIIGVSIHSLAQALRAEKLGADYIAVGPVFPTPSKPQVKPVGLGLLEKVIKRIEIPVVAIGGINEKNVENIVRVGGKRIAMIRALAESKNLKKTVKVLRRKLGSCF